MENKRLEKLILNFENNSLLVIYSGDLMYKTLDQTFPFEVDRSFYYYTSLKEETAAVVVKILNGKSETVLYKPMTDPEKAKWVGGFLDADEASLISKIDNVRDSKNLLDDVLNNLKSGDIKILYTASYPKYHVYPFYKSIESAAAQNGILVESLIPKITKQRLIKDENEIKALQKAIDVTNSGLKEVLRNITKFKNEASAQATFEKVLKENKTGIAFDTISASGENATTLHYVKNDSNIEKNSLILLDLGASYNLYNADISRTYPTNGKFSERQKLLYNIVLDTSKKAIKMVKPGVNYFDIITFAKDYLAQRLIEIGKIKEKDEIVKYYFHSVGHPLGLDVHDLGNRDIILEPGMVFTIEPGLYIKDEKIGIRIEDDILVTEKGNKVLSKNILKEVEDIEKFISDNKAG